MSAFGNRLRLADGGAYLHWCPACREIHQIYVDYPNENGSQWQFNNDAVFPTFSPSVIYDGKCHYFIKAGIIDYCADSKHDFAGRKIPMPNFNDSCWGDRVESA